MCHQEIRGEYDQHKAHYKNRSYELGQIHLVIVQGITYKSYF